jgi:DNA-binding LacI/PurR family transcriptional regulator
MVRLKDIAEQAGVSVMTVSKALRDAPDVSAATKARISALAQQLGYIPDAAAQGLRTRSSRMIGLVVSSLTNPIFARMVLAIEERAQELGYQLILAHTHNQPEREAVALQRLMARRVDGLIISPVYRLATEDKVYRELEANGTPTVILGHLAPFCSGFVNVECDDLAASQAATKHLLSLGHRRIAFLAGPPVTPWTRERFDGYRRALREANLDVDDRLVFQAGRNIQEGANATLQMINEGAQFTAVQAVNDLVAVGAAETLMQQGYQVPKDISVMGFGNILLSEHFRVPLSTVRQPKFHLGEAAIEMLLRLLRGERPTPRRLPAELVLRESTGPIAAGQLRGSPETQIP